MSAPLTELEFSQHLNTKFRAVVGDQNLEFELVEVKSYQPRENEQKGMERFSLFFQEPTNYLPQGVYHLKHDGMGDLDIFLVPIAKEGDSFRYEAVFNYYKE